MQIAKSSDSMDTTQPVTAGAAPRNRENQPPQAPDQFDILLYLRVLLAHWWVVLPITIAGTAIGYLIWANTPPIYRATCRLEILPNFKWGTTADLVTTSYRQQFLGRQQVLLQSDKLHGVVTERLRPVWESKRPPKGKNPELTIARVGEASTAMLRLSIDSFSAQYSKEYLDLLLEEFARFRYEEAASMSESTLSGLRSEQANYARQVREKNDELVAFEGEHNLLFEEKKANSHQTLLASIINQQARLAAQRRMIEYQFSFLKDADQNPAILNEVLNFVLQNAGFGSDSVSNIESDSDKSGSDASPIVINTPSAASEGVSSSDFAEWRESEALILRLQHEYDHMLKTYKPRHPKMVLLEERIGEAQRNLQISAQLTLKRLQSRYEALKLQEAAMGAAAEELRQHFNPNTKLRSQYENLRADAERLAFTKSEIDRRIMDLRSSAVDKALTHVSEEPHALRRPIWPIKSKIMTATTAGGAGLGIVLVLSLFFLKSRLYDFDTLEQSLGIECLAGIQKISLARSNKLSGTPIVVTRERSSIFSESFRNLRTTIEHSMGKEGKILLLTSPEPAEGKTLLALNTATVFSWNHARVLIIDGDFRKLSLRKTFRDAHSKGLTDALNSPDISIEECIVKSPLPELAPNLDYLPAGHRKETTTELLTTSSVGEIMQKLRDMYDFIVIDSAPVNRVVDTILLANYADAVLLVARSGRTTVPAMRYCYSRISSNNVLGYVLNGLDRSSSRYGYYSSGYYGQARYYYHSYAYKGYYGGSSTDNNADS